MRINEGIVPDGWKEFVESDSRILREIRYGGDRSSARVHALANPWGIMGQADDSVVSKPIPIFLFRCEELLEKGLEKESVWCWRILIFSANAADDSPEIAIDLLHDGDKGYSFLAALEGELLDRWIVELRDAAALLKEDDGYLSLVEIPGLFFSGFWFRGDDPHRDILIPVASRRGLQIKHSYSRAEFEPILRKMAEDELENARRSNG